jgi:hypothetical protein
MIFQSFTAGGNRLYPDLWAVIGDLRYPGYKTLTVALEPSVEQVAGAVPSTGGIIVIHMLLWVPPWNSVVRTRC